MKPYLEVEQDRVKPHKFTNKNMRAVTANSVF